MFTPCSKLLGAFTTATDQDPYSIKGVCDLGTGNGKFCFFGGGGVGTREGVWRRLKDQIAAVSAAIVVLGLS